MPADQAVPFTPVRPGQVGSLPLLPEQRRLGELLLDRLAGRDFDAGELSALAAESVAEVVGWQKDLGLFHVSDGELGQADFIDVFFLTGFNGKQSNAAFMPRDLVDAGMGEWLTDPAAFPDAPRICDGEVHHVGPATEAQIGRFTAALNAHGIDRSRAFLTTPSPATVMRRGTEYYPDDLSFGKPVIAALRDRCQMIAAAGITVQVDAPELAMLHHLHHGQSWAGFAADVERCSNAINEATDGIADVRVHVCNGNYWGPHHYDVELGRLLPLLYKHLRPCVLVAELENPRHRHDALAFSQHPLPGGWRLGAGVVDTCSMSAGHPDVVADSLVRVALAAGPGNVVMAVPDCGYRTMMTTGVPRVIAGMQLENLVRGTAIANERLAVIQANGGQAPAAA